MAFQNAFTSYKQEINIAVASLDAGPDRYQICDPDGSLSAVVEYLPGDPFVHSFEWVQVSGDPVTWISSTSALTISYTATNTPDRVFRIYADRGTAVELYDEIVVFGTPTSTVRASATSSQYSAIPCRAVTLSYQAAATSYGSLELVSSYYLTWTEPSCDVDQYFKEYWVQRKPGTGPWITFEVVSAGSVRESYTPTITDIFRVLAVYTDGGDYPSNWVYSLDVGKSGILATTVPVSNGGNASSVSTYVVDDLKLFTHLVSSDVPSGSSSISAISTYTVDDLRLIFNSDSVTLVTLGVNSVSGITAYVIDDLEGGEIGG